MSIENLDENTSVEKDLGIVRTRFNDSLYCKFRYSHKDGGSLDLYFIPRGRGSARTCSFQINSFKAFIEILKKAGDLFVEADKLPAKHEAESKALQDAIQRLTQ